MTALLLTLLGLAVIAVVAVLVVRGEPLLRDDPVQARALRWPLSEPVVAEDLTQVRFTVAVRGYRMEEVDRVLDDVRLALAQRDSHIAQLLAEGTDEAATPEDPGSEHVAAR